MAAMKINQENFEQEILQSEKPVLVDFWAPWCGPCRMIAPFLEEIAAEDESVTIGKINVDDEPELANAFGVMSIPTLVVIKEGKATAMAVGVQTAQQLDKLMAEDRKSVV